MKKNYRMFCEAPSINKNIRNEYFFLMFALVASVVTIFVITFITIMMINEGLDS